MLTVARKAAQQPAKEISGTWQVCSPKTVGAFSATAFFFGQSLQRELDVPVGLINSSWGGTAVEAWTSMAVQKKLPELVPLLDRWQQAAKAYDPQAARKQDEARLQRWQAAVKKAKAAGKRPPRRPQLAGDPRKNQNHPANLYNGMIAPLVPYAIRGAIWYQGERNSRDQASTLYGLQLKALIENWRKDWNQGEFPFLFVQLPNFQRPQQEPAEDTGWVMVREGMLKTLAVPNTGMAVTTDIGDERDIHPKNKQDVGKRLALWTLATVYGQDLVYSGPLYKSMKCQGTKIVLQFDHIGKGLVVKGEGPLQGFAIAGSDRKFVWADARDRGGHRGRHQQASPATGRGTLTTGPAIREATCSIRQACRPLHFEPTIGR